MQKYVDDIDYRIANNLRYWRIQREIKVKELADIIRVSSKTINNYENGRTTPKIDTLKKICSALNITVDDLYSIKEYGYDISQEQPKEKDTLLNVINDTNLLYFLNNTYNFSIGYKASKDAQEISYINPYDIVKFNLNSNYAVIKNNYNITTKVELVYVTYDELSAEKDKVYEKILTPFIDTLYDYSEENKSILPIITKLRYDAFYDYNPYQTISIDNFRRILSTIKNFIEYAFFQTD